MAKDSPVPAVETEKKSFVDSPDVVDKYKTAGDIAQRTSFFEIRTVVGFFLRARA